MLHPWERPEVHALFKRFAEAQQVYLSDGSLAASDNPVIDPSRGQHVRFGDIVNRAPKEHCAAVLLFKEFGHDHGHRSGGNIVWVLYRQADHIISTEPR